MDTRAACYVHHLYLPANILPIMVTDLLGSKIHRRFSLGSSYYGAKALIPSRGDLSGQYYGANVKDDRHRVLCWDAKGHGKRDSERMHLI